MYRARLYRQFNKQLSLVNFAVSNSNSNPPLSPSFHPITSESLGEFARVMTWNIAKECAMKQLKKSSALAATPLYVTHVPSKLSHCMTGIEPRSPSPLTAPSPNSDEPDAKCSRLSSPPIFPTTMLSSVSVGPSINASSFKPYVRSKAKGLLPTSNTSSCAQTAVVAVASSSSFFAGGEKNLESVPKESILKVAAATVSV
ncbi:MAG: hypothetical protein WCW01_06080 [Gammaproteobacteria bacterium]